MSLEEKSIVDLRAIAQGLSAGWTNGDDRVSLIAKIDKAVQSRIAKPEPLPEPTLPYDHALRTRAPAKNLKQTEVYTALTPYFARGLVLTFPDAEHWHMRVGMKREDMGTLRMPLRVIDSIAREMLKTKWTPA